MTLQERLQVIEAVVEVAAGRVPIIAGAQSLDVRECVTICQFCEQVGVDAVQISGPFYYDGHPKDVVAWMDEVASHTRVGFALYNNWYTGYDMPIEVIDSLLEIPNSVGLKWASPRIDTFFQGVERFGGRVALINNTLNTIPGHVAGCGAFVSHFPNFWPDFCWRVWDLMEDQLYREAHVLFETVMGPYRELVAQISSETAGEGVFVRPAMRAVGLDGGYSRLPSRDEAVGTEVIDGFRRFLAEFDAISDTATAVQPST